MVMIDCLPLFKISRSSTAYWSTTYGIFSGGFTEGRGAAAPPRRCPQNFFCWPTLWIREKRNRKTSQKYHISSVGLIHTTCHGNWCIALFASMQCWFFPNIRTLLLITATLPVSTATTERTFSSLRLLKSYLRTTMGKNRLAGLTLLYLHRDIPITPDGVIVTFARHSSRRLEFVLQ